MSLSKYYLNLELMSAPRRAAAPVLLATQWSSNSSLVRFSLVRFRLATLALSDSAPLRNTRWWGPGFWRPARSLAPVARARNRVRLWTVTNSRSRAIRNGKRHRRKVAGAPWKSRHAKQLSMIPRAGRSGRRPSRRRSGVYRSRW